MVKYKTTDSGNLRAGSLNRCSFLHTIVSRFKTNWLKYLINFSTVVVVFHPR